MAYQINQMSNNIINPIPLYSFLLFNFEPNLTFDIFHRFNMEEHGTMESIDLDVSKVTKIMRENVSKIIERDIRLEVLNETSEQLKSKGSAFENTSRLIRRKMWWKNTKQSVITGCVVLILILIIVLVIMLPR
jgi:hypothetical protein